MCWKVKYIPSITSFTGVFITFFYFRKHFSYKYKEASKQHLFYSTITYLQNICLSYDFGKTSERFYYKEDG